MQKIVDNNSQKSKRNLKENLVLRLSEKVLSDEGKIFRSAFAAKLVAKAAEKSDAQKAVVLHEKAGDRYASKGKFPKAKDEYIKAASLISMQEEKNEFLLKKAESLEHLGDELRLSIEKGDAYSSAASLIESFEPLKAAAFFEKAGDAYAKAADAYALTHVDLMHWYDRAAVEYLKAAEIMKKLSGGKALFNRNFDKSLALIKKAADVMQRAL